MIDLSPEAQRHVPTDRVAHIYNIRARREAQLAEAKAILGNKHLTAWRAEAMALVTSLAGPLAAHETKIAAFEATIEPLERAIVNERAAREVFDRAKERRAVGSMDRAEALKLRDDVEAADQVLLIRRRELEAAAAATRSFLPQNDGIPEGPGRDTCEAIAAFVTNRKFRPEHSSGSIDRDAWARWLETSETELMWIPLHAARVIASAKEDPYVGVDFRRELVTLPVPEFVAELSKFKAERESHLKSKLQAAHAALEAAKQAAAALEGRGA